MYYILAISKVTLGVAHRLVACEDRRGYIEGRLARSRETATSYDTEREAMAAISAIRAQASAYAPSGLSPPEIKVLSINVQLLSKYVLRTIELPDGPTAG